MNHYLKFLLEAWGPFYIPPSVVESTHDARFAHSGPIEFSSPHTTE